MEGLLKAEDREESEESKSGSFVELEQRQEETNQLYLFNLRLLALLLCRGELRTKADILSQMVTRSSDSNLPVSWKNPRLIEALRRLFYFSEILPKKFYLEV